MFLKVPLEVLEGVPVLGRNILDHDIVVSLEYLIQVLATELPVRADVEEVDEVVEAGSRLGELEVKEFDLRSICIARVHVEHHVVGPEVTMGHCVIGQAQSFLVKEDFF